MAEIERRKSEESKRREEMEKALEEEKQKHAAVPLSLACCIKNVLANLFRPRKHERWKNRSAYVLLCAYRLK
jgi:hypothetical protein